MKECGTVKGVCVYIYIYTYIIFKAQEQTTDVDMEHVWKQKGIQTACSYIIMYYIGSPYIDVICFL